MPKVGPSRNLDERKGENQMSSDTDFPMATSRRIRNTVRQELGPRCVGGVGERCDRKVLMNRVKNHDSRWQSCTLWEFYDYGAGSEIVTTK